MFELVVKNWPKHFMKPSKISCESVKNNCCKVSYLTGLVGKSDEGVLTYRILMY